jgi:hypothetical protein
MEKRNLIYTIRAASFNSTVYYTYLCIRLYTRSLSGLNEAEETPYCLTNISVTYYMYDVREKKTQIKIKWFLYIIIITLCLLYISIGQCLSYSVFYDFVSVYCISQSANVYLILYSTIFSLFIVHLDRPMFILFCILQSADRNIQ